MIETDVGECYRSHRKRQVVRLSGPAAHPSSAAITAVDPGQVRCADRTVPARRPRRTADAAAARAAVRVESFCLGTRWQGLKISPTLSSPGYSGRPYTRGDRA